MLGTGNRRLPTGRRRHCHWTKPPMDSEWCAAVVDRNPRISPESIPPPPPPDSHPRPAESKGVGFSVGDVDAVARGACTHTNTDTRAHPRSHAFKHNSTLKRLSRSRHEPGHVFDCTCLTVARRRRCTTPPQTHRRPRGRRGRRPRREAGKAAARRRAAPVMLLMRRRRRRSRRGSRATSRTETPSYCWVERERERKREREKREGGREGGRHTQLALIPKGKNAGILRRG